MGRRTAAGKRRQELPDGRGTINTRRKRTRKATRTGRRTRAGQNTGRKRSSGAEERDENIKRGVKQYMVVVGWWIW